MARVKKKRKLQKSNDPDVIAKKTEIRPAWLLDSFLITLVCIVAVALLFINLDDKYLWQDEAATAVLGERMMRYGKPFAYDGKNLITMDHFAGEDLRTIDSRTGDAKTAIQYYVDHRDFKADTTWIGQPWGQFIAAGTSLLLFGHNTVGARAPFAAAAVLTIVLLYWFIKTNFQDRFMAALAAGLVLTNTYWVLHSRQCRYYALTCLLVLVLLMVYAHWQRGNRIFGALFVVAAWCLFQVDFGTFWPVILLLLFLAGWRTWPRVTEPALLALSAGVAVAPWVWYYELFDRLKISAAPWSEKFLTNLFTMNQFMIPLLVLIAAGLTLLVRRREYPALQRQLLFASLMILLVSLFWVTSVTPSSFYRYLVHLTPLAALLTAWTLVESGKWIVRKWQAGLAATLVTVFAGAVIALSPLLSNVISAMIPSANRLNHPLGTIVRPELATLRDEVFRTRVDPNRAAIEKVKSMAGPSDEILVNYEDIPFMFYTDNPIRGGIPCFRVEDRVTQPRFLVLRQSVRFVHWPVFLREVHRYAWRRTPVHAPDIPFGNNPDPAFQLAWAPRNLPDLLVAERVSDASAAKH